MLSISLPRNRFAGRALSLALVALLPACAAIERAKNIGETPPLAAIDNPTAQAGYRPVQMPMPPFEPAIHQPNSLWQSGARAFFKDQRARQIGDILTVRVQIKDEAQIDNSTSRSRTSAEDMGIDSFAGLELALANQVLPTGAQIGDIIDVDGATKTAGTGSIKREEAVTTSIAAVIIQVLPNGNLVIEGKQEVRVNYEVRELIVTGIVRPEDIGSDNTIDSSKIAEARIAYGGRGQITDMQQPRYGQQILDILLPF